MRPHAKLTVKLRILSLSIGSSAKFNTAKINSPNRHLRDCYALYGSVKANQRPRGRSDFPHDTRGEGVAAGQPIASHSPAAST